MTNKRKKKIHHFNKTAKPIDITYPQYVYDAVKDIQDYYDGCFFKAVQALTQPLPRIPDDYR